jgi:hypothetical protein
MSEYFVLSIGNVKATEIEIFDQMYTDEINETSTKGKVIELEKMPKLFFKPFDGEKTDLVRGAVSFPVVSEKLKICIEKSGDKNAVFHKVDMIALGKDEISLEQSYYFMNILNRVDCFDLEKSEYTTDKEYPSVITKVKKIYLDSSRVGDRQIFRIKQDSFLIIISEKLKKIIESENITGIKIDKLENI